jgi:leucyl aminopeptidase
MQINFAAHTIPDKGSVVILAFEGRKLTDSGMTLDKQANGAVLRAIKQTRFEGKKDQSLMLAAPQSLKLDRLLVIGMGAPRKIDALTAENAGGKAVQELNSAGATAATFLVDAIPGCKLPPAELSASVAFGARLGSYRFDKYRTKEKSEAKPTLKGLSVATSAAAAAERSYAPLARIADGVVATRDLVSEPANVIYPDTFAKEALKLRKLGVKVEVLDGPAMKKLGMGALLGVAQGSAHEPRLVVMQWNGGARGSEPVAFVGKGVTFDTGGISIKPAGGMEDMKWDMAGAGAVLGAMQALAGRKARANVVGVCALVENMPSGTAQRPGDVVRSMSGQTIEVINTDAEGRLILADAVWYTQNRFKPRCIVDLATLTGAIIVALGHELAGLFASDDRLAEQLTDAGKAVGERLWRMPLGEDYNRHIDSDIADMKNVGRNREAGSTAGAVFIQRYTNGVKWAHLDIAGVVWSSKSRPTIPKGATAFGVRLLDRLVRDHYERR